MCGWRAVEEAGKLSVPWLEAEAAEKGYALGSLKTQEVAKQYSLSDSLNLAALHKYHNQLFRVCV